MPSLIWPLLTSTNPSKPLSLSHHRQAHRPPRVRTAAFPPHPPHLLHHLLMVMGFTLSCKLARVIQPDMRFVFLGSAFCRRLPSDPTSRWTPLPLANSFHHQDLQGTCTPKLLPMPGTRETPPAGAGGIFKLQALLEPSGLPLHLQTGVWSFMRLNQAFSPYHCTEASLIRSVNISIYNSTIL